tara:strand:+ start:5801 stop:6244 length:444 start_codon:yes stop_codon:yes gene_type:complete
MEKSIQSNSTNETQRIAKELAAAVLESPQRTGAFVLALQGELGSGKTTFAQGFAKGFGIKDKILSPTFLIVKKYEIRNTRYFYHIDCYRLKAPKELLQLDWKEIVADPKNIVLVEWADRVRRVVPNDALWISFSHRGTEKRTVRFGL